MASYSQWAHQWKMLFDPDLNKQATEKSFCHNISNSDLILN